MATYGFDGVDIAFEFSDEDVPEDKLALTTLLEVGRDLIYNYV
jgi:chitinase